MLCYGTQCKVMLYLCILCKILSYHVILQPDVQYFFICYTILPCAITCYTVTCSTILYYVVVFYLMQYFTVLYNTRASTNIDVHVYKCARMSASGEGEGTIVPGAGSASSIRNMPIFMSDLCAVVNNERSKELTGEGASRQVQQLRGCRDEILYCVSTPDGTEDPRH